MPALTDVKLRALSVTSGSLVVTARFDIFLAPA